MTAEEMLKLDTWYVVSPDTLRTLIDYVCEKDPNICKQIFDLNQ